SASRRDGIAFASVRLFPNAQLVQFLLPGGPVDHGWERGGVEAFGEMGLIRCIHRWFLSLLFLLHSGGLMESVDFLAICKCSYESILKCGQKSGNDHVTRR